MENDPPDRENDLALACGLTDRDDHGSHLVTSSTLRPGGDFTSNEEEVDCPWCLEQMLRDQEERDDSAGEELKERLERAMLRHRSASATTGREEREPETHVPDDDLPF